MASACCTAVQPLYAHVATAVQLRAAPHLEMPVGFGSHAAIVAQLGAGFCAHASLHRKRSVCFVADRRAAGAISGKAVCMQGGIIAGRHQWVLVALLDLLYLGGRKHAGGVMVIPEACIIKRTGGGFLCRAVS